MVKRVVAAFMYEVFEIVVFELLNKNFSVLRPTFVEVNFFFELNRQYCLCRKSSVFWDFLD